MNNSFSKIMNSKSLFFQLLKPVASPYKLIRVGKGGDGTYLIPNNLEGIKDCFSPGGATYKIFEDELLCKWGIKSHICDYSSCKDNFTTPFKKGQQTFEKMWLSPVPDKVSITLSQWIAKYSPIESDDLLLQMDIEGAEYSILSNVDVRTLNRFRIIVIELHDLNHLEAGDEKSSQIVKAVERLTANHSCIHLRANNCTSLHHHPGTILIDPDTGANIPSIMEVTLLRNDLIYNCKVWYSPQIPHPQDIYSNIYLNPPLHLNANWLETSIRSKSSTLKIELDYIHHYWCMAKHSLWRLPLRIARFIMLVMRRG